MSSFLEKLVKYLEGLRYDLASLQRGHRINRLPTMSNVLKESLILKEWEKLSAPNPPTSIDFLQKILRIYDGPLEEYFRDLEEY